MIKIMAVKFQVLIMLALLTALSVFVLVNFFNYMNSWKASDRLNDEGRTFTQVLAAAVFNDIKARDFRALEKNVKNAVQNLRYVSRVIVYDKEDNTLFNWKTDRKSELINLRYFEKKIYNNRDYLGTVKIAIEPRQLDYRDDEYSYYIQSFAVLVLLLLSLLSALIVSLFLISPIERITNSLNNSTIILEENKKDLSGFQKLTATVQLLKRNIKLLHEREKETEYTKLQLSSVLDTVGEAIITIDKDGFIVMTNKATENIWGYNINDLINMNLTALIPEEYRQRHKDGMKRYLETGQAKVLNKRMELKGLRANGEVFPIEIYISETRIVDEVLFTAALRDITERKQAENELHQAKYKIEEILNERTIELKATQLQLIQTEKLETIGTLSAGVAHEVKNPLAIIQLGVDYLASKKDVFSDIKEVITEMNEAVQRADTVVKQLVDFSASREVHIKEMNVSELVDDALGMIKHELMRAKIKVDNVIQDHSLLILGDKQKLKQVFINIFMNSIHAMEVNGIIIVNAQKKSVNEIDFDLTQNNKFKDEIIVVTIEDNGSGIPEDKLENIFEPFFTTKPAGKGTGLGLTVVQNILRLHESVIHYENSEPDGVKVTILFNATGV